MEVFHNIINRHFWIIKSTTNLSTLKPVYNQEPIIAKGH